MNTSENIAHDTALTYYHAPQSRSASGLWLLEELQVPYRVEIVDIRGQGGAPESYRAVHPHKKVPAIAHQGAVITERAAIAIYLGDAFPSADVAPAVGDPARGPYLRWHVYLEAVFDPAVTAQLFKWEYDPHAVSFGSFVDLERHLRKTLEAGPYLLGPRATLADLELVSSLGWVMPATGLFTDKPVFAEYVARVQDRPSFARSQRREQQLAAAHSAT
jgi:glutathione S-transferase